MCMCADTCVCASGGLILQALSTLKTIFAYECVQVCTQACLPTIGFVGGDQWKTAGVGPHRLLCLKQRLLFAPVFARLASGGFLVGPHLTTGKPGSQTHYCVLWPSSLHGKSFTYWAISPAPLPPFNVKTVPHRPGTPQVS